MKRLRDEWDVALEQMFEALVEAGEWEVAGRDAQGRPTSWRMTDETKARMLRDEGRLQ
jgi:hypothetical protein